MSSTVSISSTNLGSPSLYDGSTDEDYLIDTPSPIFLGKRKNATISKDCRPKKSKTNSENVPPLGDVSENTNSRLLRSKPSTASEKFNSALSSLKHQRSKRAKDSESKPNFNMLSDTDSDFDFLEDDTFKSKLPAESSSTVTHSRPLRSSRSSKVVFACGKSPSTGRTKAKGEDTAENNGRMPLRRKHSVVPSFIYSDSSDSDFSRTSEKKKRNSKEKISSQRKRSVASNMNFSSFSDSTDSEIRTVLRAKTTRKKSRKHERKKSDEFLPVVSDLSSSDIDETDFSSYLSHLVGNNSKKKPSRKSKRSKATAAQDVTTDESDDDVAILDYMVSGKKSKKSAKDISFPETKTRSKQGSLLSFVLGKNPQNDTASTSTKSRVLPETRISRSASSTVTRDVSNPNIQTSSMSDELLVVHALEAVDVTMPHPMNTRIERTVGNCRRPGLSGKRKSSSQNSPGPASKTRVSASRGRESIDAVRTLEQLHNDEAFARQLQEEIDREMAASLRSEPLAGFVPVSSIVNQPEQHSTSQGPLAPTDGDSNMLQTIAAMDDYVWQIHEAVVQGVDIPAAPQAYRNRDVNELLNFEVIAYVDGRSRANSLFETEKIRREANTLFPNRPVQEPVTSRAVPQPVASRVRGNRGLPAAGTPILARIGAMTDEEWQFHRSVFHGTTPPRAGRQRNVYTLDTEVLQYLAERETVRRGREEEIASHLSDSDESVDELLEQLRSSIYGTTQGRTRSSGRRGRGRGRGRAGARGGRNLERLVDGVEDEDDYENLLELAEQLGSVKSAKGLSAGQIDMLPTKAFKTSSLKEGEAVPECHVCMCEYEENEQMRILTCFHSFHAECIDKWIKTNPSCPVCRSEIKFS